MCLGGRAHSTDRQLNNARIQLVPVPDFVHNVQISHPPDSLGKVEPFSPRPTVLLCPWYGASERAIQRYVRLFHAWGYIVATVIAPTNVVFALRANTAVKFCAAILLALTKASQENSLLKQGALFDGGLVLMCMSTAGATMAYGLACLSIAVDGAQHYTTLKIKMDAALKTVINRVRKALVAIIFDSGPAKMHDTLGARALAIGQGVDPASALGSTIRILHTIFSTMRRTVFDDVPFYFWDCLHRADYGTSPELYIFSHADRFIDVAALDQLIYARQKAGHDVSSVQVDHAPHVGILKHYPHDYIHALAQFLQHATNTYRARLGLSIWPHSLSVYGFTTNVPAKL